MDLGKSFIGLLIQEIYESIENFVYLKPFSL